MNKKTQPTESAPEGERPPDSGGERRRKLTRSRDDRYIGGVAAGIGDYLGIDPVLIRLAFVASLFFGGIGVLVYLVLLAAVPIEGDPDVPPEPVEGRKRNLVIAGTVAVGILALISVGGSGFTAWIFGFGPGVVFGIFAWLAAAGLLTLLLLAARHEPAPSAPPSPSAGSTAGATTAGATPTAGDTPAAGRPSAAARPSAAGDTSTAAASKAPGEPPPVIAPSPSQTAPTGVLPRQEDDPTAVMPGGPAGDAPSTIGTIMTWFAIGMASLVVLSVLAISAAWITAVAGAVPMASLVILLGVGMVVAGIRGRRGIAAWMLVVALALALPMAVVSIADLRIEGSYGEVTETPTIAGDLPEDGYKLAGGEMTIDLREYPFRSGRTLEIPVSSGFGLTSVVVPDRVCVAGQFSGKAGLIDVRGTESSGVNIDRTIGNPGNGGPTLVLDAEIKLGAFEVADNTEWRANGSDPGNLGTFNHSDAQNRAVRARAIAACERAPGGGKSGGKAGSRPGSSPAGQEQGSGQSRNSGNGGSAG